MIQIITGVTLAMHYNASLAEAFNSVEHIMRDVNSGWLIRYLHANTASVFFLVVYLHIGRGFYYGSYKAPRTLVWTIGTIIFILMMATAFLGYVLPYGQMSLWGATVITNLMSAIPWVGQDIVEFIWGGFSVNNATLNRFFSLHFVLPFVLAALVVMHLITLHDSAGSGNPLGISANYDRLAFAPFFIFKDLITIFIIVAAIACFLFFMPNVLGDSENYVVANPMQTPPAIVPEWYLLPFYAILRSIPNKLLGVIAMFSAILILLVLPLTDLSKSRGLQYRPASRICFYVFIGNFLILMVLGARHVEDPFIVYGQISTVLYFLYFLVVMPLVSLFENSFNDITTRTQQEEQQQDQQDQQDEQSIYSRTPSYAGISSSVFNLSRSGLQIRQFSTTRRLLNDNDNDNPNLTTLTRENIEELNRLLDEKNNPKADFVQDRLKDYIAAREETLYKLTKELTNRDNVNAKSCEHSDNAVYGKDGTMDNYPAVLEDATLSLLKEIDDVTVPKLQAEIAELEQDIVGLVNAAEKVLADEEVDVAKYAAAPESPCESPPISSREPVYGQYSDSDEAQETQQVAQPDQTQETQQVAQPDQTQETQQVAQLDQTQETQQVAEAANEKVAEVVNAVEKVLTDERVLEVAKAVADIVSNS